MLIISVKCAPKAGKLSPKVVKCACNPAKNTIFIGILHLNMPVKLKIALFSGKFTCNHTASRAHRLVFLRI